MNILFIHDSKVNIGSTRIHSLCLADYLKKIGINAKTTTTEHVSDYKNYDVYVLGKSVKYDVINKVQSKALVGDTNPDDNRKIKSEKLFRNEI